MAWLPAVLAAIVLVLAVAGRRARVADWGHPVLNVLDGLNRLFCRYYHHLRADPIPLPAAGPALVAANHLSGLDPMLMMAASPRPLRFMIATEQYHRFGLEWFFRWIGCIPVDRERAPQKAFRAALTALAAGEVVAMFPHGRIRHRGERPPHIKSGVVRLARLAHAPIYPVLIGGVRGQGYTVMAPFIPSHARLRAFPPLDCSREDPGTCLKELARLLDDTDPAAGPEQAAAD